MEPDPSTDRECVSKTVTQSIADPLVTGQTDVNISPVTIEEVESWVRYIFYMSHFSNN